MPVPAWVRDALAAWLAAARLSRGRVFRPVNKGGRLHGAALTEKAVWTTLREHAMAGGLGVVAPHDLRRSCARLCRAAGAAIEQIQFLLGHASVKTTERYLGAEQDLRDAPNDRLSIAVPAAL